MTISPEIQGALMVAVVLYFVVSAMLDGAQPGTDDYPERHTVAELDVDPELSKMGIEGSTGVNVAIVTDAATGAGLVRLTLVYEKSEENALITPAQAHELAEWLRIASSPGRTLEEARFNRRHGGHSSLPG